MLARQATATSNPVLHSHTSSTMLPTGKGAPSLPVLNGSKPVRPSPLAQTVATPDDSVLPTPADAPPLTPAISGNIISATCFTPYTIGYRRKTKGAARGDLPAWELTPRRGSSALYDTLKHLAGAESQWNHTIVGWTGDIQELGAKAASHPLQHLQNSRTARMGNPPPANGMRQQGPLYMKGRTKSYQIPPPPLPVFGGTNNRMTMKGTYDIKRPEEEQVPSVDLEDREELQRVLQDKCKDVGWQKIRTVWLGDEEDGGIVLENMDRWVQYADKGLFPKAFPTQF